MNQANGEKKLLEEGLPVSYPRSNLERQHSKMPSLRKLMAIMLVLALVGCSWASANRLPRSPTLANQKKFQDILDGVESPSLHDLLHEHIENYKEVSFTSLGKWIMRI